MSVNMNSNLPTDPGKLHAGALMNNQHNLDAVAKAGAEHAGAVALRTKTSTNTSNAAAIANEARKGDEDKGAKALQAGGKTTSTDTTSSTGSDATSTDAGGIQKNMLEGLQAMIQEMPASTLRDSMHKLVSDAISSATGSTSATSSSSSSSPTTWYGLGSKSTSSTASNSTVSTQAGAADIQKKAKEGQLMLATQNKDEAGMKASQAALDAMHGNIFSTSNPASA
jgi:hypothetical protein